MRMTVTSRIVLLIAGLAVVSLAGSAYLSHRQAKIVDAATRHLADEFETKRNGGENSLKMFVNDYSYWDELVSFVQKGDRSWAEDTFAACIPDYEADAIWVYRPDFSVAYAVNALKSKDLGSIPVPRPAFEGLFSTSRFCHFFVNVPNGVMEIYGASIHPTHDTERKTEPQGFLLAGRVWNDDYCARLGKLTGATVTLAVAPSGEKNGDPGMVTFSKRLEGWNGKTLARAVVTTEARALAPVLADLRAHSKNQFYVTASLSLFVLAVVTFLLVKWVITPLSAALRLARTEDVSIDLPGDTSEFGELVRLMHGHLEEKANYSREVLLLRHAEEDTRREVADLARRINELSKEGASLKEALKKNEETKTVTQDCDAVRKTNAELEQKLRVTEAKLHVIDELLKRQIIAEHEHHKEKHFAQFEKDQMEDALKKAYAELAQRTAELISVRKMIGENGEGRIKGKGKNDARASFNEAVC